MAYEREHLSVIVVGVYADALHSAFSAKAFCFGKDAPRETASQCGMQNGHAMNNSIRRRREPTSFECIVSWFAAKRDGCISHYFCIFLYNIAHARIEVGLSVSFSRVVFIPLPSPLCHHGLCSFTKDAEYRIKIRGADRSEKGLHIL